MKVRKIKRKEKAIETVALEFSGSIGTTLFVDVPEEAVGIPGVSVIGELFDIENGEENEVGCRLVATVEEYPIRLHMVDINLLRTSDNTEDLVGKLIETIFSDEDLLGILASAITLIVQIHHSLTADGTEK